MEISTREQLFKLYKDQPKTSNKICRICQSKIYAVYIKGVKHTYCSCGKIKIAR